MTKEYIDFISSTALFQGMSPAAVATAVHCLQSAVRQYRKGEIILSSGDTTDRIGLVAEGSVTVEVNDLWGGHTLISTVPQGRFFGEAYALTPGSVLPVDVLANDDCTIIFFRIDGLLSGGICALDGKECREPMILNALTANLLRIAVGKNRELSARNVHTSPKTIRGKVLMYLNTVALQQRSTFLEIPYDRQQLADYLNVDRTALSKELARMKKDGLIDFHKSTFRILGTPQ